MTKLANLFCVPAIQPSLAAQNEAQVLHELAARLADLCACIDPEVIERVLTAREILGSTAIGNHVAIPHGRLAGTTSIVACLGRTQQGIRFGAADGSTTHLFVAIVGPENATTGLLRAIARTSRLFKDEEFCSRLLLAEDAKAMHSIIVGEDERRR